jgi:Ni2+-binding GTPase involved in maturation of urease and hydrogenase
VLEALNQRVDDVASLNSKLIIVIGPPLSGKTRLLNALAKQRQLGAVNVGVALGHLLLEVPGRPRFPR